MQRPAVAMDRGAASGLVPAGIDTHSKLSVAAITAPLLVGVPLLIVLVIVRRASGALAHPLPSAGLIVCGLLLAAWAVLARDTLANRRAHDRGWQSTSVWLPPAVLLVAGWTLLLPGSSVVGAFALIGILVAEELAAWGLRTSSPISRPPDSGLQTLARPSAVDTAVGDSAEVVIAEIIRRREPDGGESIRGWARVELAAGQRTAPVHVAFCPALAGMPLCEAEQSAGPAASVRVAQVLPLGARFEVKLDAPAKEAVSVEIEFSAIASAGEVASE